MPIELTQVATEVAQVVTANLPMIGVAATGFATSLYFKQTRKAYGILCVAGGTLLVKIGVKLGAEPPKDQK